MQLMQVGRVVGPSPRRAKVPGLVSARSAGLPKRSTRRCAGEPPLRGRSPRTRPDEPFPGGDGRRIPRYSGAETRRLPADATDRRGRARGPAASRAAPAKPQRLRPGGRCPREAQWPQRVPARRDATTVERHAPGPGRPEDLAGRLHRSWPADRRRRQRERVDAPPQGTEPSAVQEQECPTPRSIGLTRSNHHTHRSRKCRFTSVGSWSALPCC